jgi:hypothetical protein
MTARKYSAIFIVMAGLACIALQCSAADAEPVDVSTSNTVADVVPLPAELVVPPYATAAAPEVPAAGGADTVAVASKSSWSPQWSKIWIRVTMFWQNSVWYSSWFTSLNRAVQVRGGDWQGRSNLQGVLQAMASRAVLSCTL